MATEPDPFLDVGGHQLKVVVLMPKAQSSVGIRGHDGAMDAGDFRADDKNGDIEARGQSPELQSTSPAARDGNELRIALE